MNKSKYKLIGCIILIFAILLLVIAIIEINNQKFLVSFLLFALGTIGGELSLQAIEKLYL